MGDEQTILLGPEEELTSVRERLEKTQARRIILVIPAQTQLRSHVGWRLIHARMRELGKELLVISPDRQVRAVARAAGFQVSETQETPSNRPRLGGGTRPGALNAREAGRSRLGSSRGGPESQATQQPGVRRIISKASNKPVTRPSAPGRSDYEEDEDTLERLRRREAQASQQSTFIPPSFLIEPEEQFDSAYGFDIRATPSARPVVPQIDEDDDDEAFKISYESDYDTAQRILKAAQEGKQANEIEMGGPGSMEIIEDLGDLGSIDLPEIQTPGKASGHLREQRERPRSRSGQMQPGSRPSPRSPRPAPPGFDDEDEPLAMPERPAHGAPRSSRPSRGLNQRPSQGLKPNANQRPSQGLKPNANQRPSQGLKPNANQRPSQGLKPNASQRPSQGLKPGASQRPSQGLKPGANQRPSQTLNPAQGQRPSQGLKPNGGQRSSQTLNPNQGQRGSQASKSGMEQRGPQQMSPGQGQRGSQPSRSASQGRAQMRVLPGGQRPANQQNIPQARQPLSPRRAPSKNRGRVAIVFIALILLFCLTVVLYAVVPAATVTVSLYASSYTQTVQLNATTNAQANLPNRALAHVVGTTITVSGQGTASSTTKVGNAQAQGTITFNNTSSNNLTIPTNTVIATVSGIQFITGAEVVVLQNSSFPSVPITALLPGESGNVAVNKITVLPPASLSSIAQHSKLNQGDVTATNLTVTNDTATSGGGASTVPAASQRDFQALAKTLHKKAQQEVQTWLTTQVHDGDARGKLVPDVLASTDLLTAEQVSATPGVGQPANGGVFSATLTLHISVLVARAADLRAAAGGLLNTAALHMRPAKMLAEQLPITLTHIQSTPSQDGSTLAISADASGELIPQLDTNAIASSLTNKGLIQAQNDLKNGVGIPNLSGVKSVQITITPSFLSILPVQAGRIRVLLVPLAKTPPQHLKNGP